MRDWVQARLIMLGTPAEKSKIRIRASSEKTGKEKLVIIGALENIDKATQNSGSQTRETILASVLRQEYHRSNRAPA